MILLGSNLLGSYVAIPAIHCPTIASFMLFLPTSPRAVRIKALERGGKKQEQMQSAPASSHGGLVGIFSRTRLHTLFIKEGKAKYNASDINWQDASA